ncbi:MAG: glycosyltransferase [Bacteroidales bacterium]
MNIKNPPRALVCPLDWGLGHATRDVKIIHGLIANGFEVIIGADNAPLFFLRENFPDLKFIRLPSAKISYPVKGSMTLKMLFSIPVILKGIIREHFLLKKIIREFGIQVVISDNRYGLWNKNVYSVFITHQVFIQTPFKWNWPGILLNKMNAWFISKFNECWIPDLPGNKNLSGILSHKNKLPVNHHFIGILSRFEVSLNEKSLHDLLIPDILVILSGPEPQRSILENIIVRQLQQTSYKAIIIKGKPGESEINENENITFYNHLPTAELKSLIVKSPVVICRSGYSTIMDLVVLQKTVILIPTPGQTEQEYLAGYMKERNWFYTINQKEFILQESINQLSKYRVPDLEVINTGLTERISRLKSIIG